MTGISNYFYSSGRPPKINPKPDKSPTVWETTRLSFDGEWDDLVNCTSYDLEEGGIKILRKHIQCFKTESPGYLLFVNNQSDPLDLSSQIEEDIGTTWEWTLRNKAPWENNYGENPPMQMISKVTTRKRHT